jgi:hypothetical protein
VTDGGNCDRTVLMPDEWGLPQWIPVGWLPSGGEIFIDLKPGPEARIAGPLRALKQVGDYLEVIKQPGANTVQCLWLDLYDGNLADDGVIPIGSALVSLRSTPTGSIQTSTRVTTTSGPPLYDKLSSTSLLFRDVAVELHLTTLSA